VNFRELAHAPVDGRHPTLQYRDVARHREIGGHVEQVDTTSRIAGRDLCEIPRAELLARRDQLDEHIRAIKELIRQLEVMLTTG
jgi:hypothetical protein